MNTKTGRYICIHGHFYQPPRENPWLDAIEKEESASPYHDWNERITAECYGPNSRSRIQDNQGVITRISNNFKQISFNFGPTLLSWMEGKAPGVLKGIQWGDLQSRKTFGEHGNALAQAYNHIILPLALERDIVTQVRWGQADFRKRFNREPEGLWLPETAVDLRTLKVLAQEGIKFTILAPHQAKRFRPLGQKEWTENQGNLNTRRPYWCRLPEGQKIALFFYDGDLSHGIAFKDTLESGEALRQGLLNGFETREEAPQLVHVATDWESYGHHHAFGDMALAYALHLLEQDPGLELINYGYYLARYPPQFEVELNENTSWSCAHGLERWRSDCGCCNGSPGQHQAWRAPLREGLDRLKKELDRLFEAQAAVLLKDPWEARDAYIGVVLDRSAENLERFFVEQGGKRTFSPAERVKVLKLLEMQRHGLLMFTSCGWFFDEISGLETTQILKYACRAIQLAGDFGSDLEPRLLQSLQQAPSNLKEYGTGAGVWEKKVAAVRLDLDQVLAHYALGMIYRNREQEEKTYCYRISRKDQVIVPQKGAHLSIGHLQGSSTITLEGKESLFAVIHFGGIDFQCWLKTLESQADYETLKKELLRLYKTASLGDVYDRVNRFFGERRYYLKDLFSEERQKLIEVILQEGMENHIRLMEKWVEEDMGTMIKLVDLGVPWPKPMEMTLNLIFERALQKGLAEALTHPHRLDLLEEFFSRSRELGYPLSKEKIWEAIQEKIEKAVVRLGADPDPAGLFAAIQGVIQTARQMAVPLPLWNIQNSFLDACRVLPENRPWDRGPYKAFAREIEIPPELISWRAE